MTDEPEYTEPTGAHLERRKEWEVRRARGQRSSEDQRPLDYSPIVFPECPGLCHASYVVAGRMAATRPDFDSAVAATRDVLEHLGLIEIMTNGGDGRKLKIQRGPVADDEPAPLGYADDDLGRPISKPKPVKQRTERRNYRNG